MRNEIVITCVVLASVAIFLSQNKGDNSESNETLAVSSSSNYLNNADSNHKEINSKIKKYEHQKKGMPYTELKSFFDINEYNYVSYSALTNCNTCLQLMKQELSNNINLSVEKVDILLSNLKENNEVVNLLIESVTLRIKQQGGVVDDISGIVMSKLVSFTSLETAKISIENLKNNNLPIELKNTLIEQIDNTKDRAATASYLVSTFGQDKEKLLEIAHPESLALLKRQKDELSYSAVDEALVENSSQYTPFVFLDLFNKANDVEKKDIAKMAETWASNQLSGSRIDFIEENLSENLFSSEDKILIERILKNAEDKSTSADLLQKYFVPTL